MQRKSVVPNPLTYSWHGSLLSRFFGFFFHGLCLVMGKWEKKKIKSAKNLKIVMQS